MLGHLLALPTCSHVRKAEVNAEVDSSLDHIIRSFRETRVDARLLHRQRVADS